MKKILILILLNLLLAVSIEAQSKKQSLAIIRKDAMSYIVYSDGTKEMLPFFVMEAEGVSDGLSRAKVMFPDKKRSYVYLDKDAKIIIRPNLPSNYEGRFLSLVNNHIRFIGYDIDTEQEVTLLFDRKGNMLFKKGFKDVGQMGDNGWVFLHDDKNYHGFYDLFLKKRLSLPDSLSGYYTGFSGGISLIENKKFLVGAINDKGKIILPTAYDYQKLLLLEGVLFLQEGDDLKLIDKNGKTFTTLEKAYFDESYIPQFKKGLVPLIIQSDEAILVNKKGKKVSIIPDVKQIVEFDGEVLTVISQDDKYAVYSKKGKLINTFTYKHLGGFVEGYAYFFDGKKGGYVNLKGEELILDWDVIWDIRNGSLFF